MRGLSLVAASGGHSSSRCAGLSLSRPLLLRSTGSRRAGSVVVAHGPSGSAACGIFPDQGSNPCPLHNYCATREALSWVFFKWQSLPPKCITIWILFYLGNVKGSMQFLGPTCHLWKLWLGEVHKDLKGQSGKTVSEAGVVKLLLSLCFPAEEWLGLPGNIGPCPKHFVFNVVLWQHGSQTLQSGNDS